MLANVITLFRVFLTFLVIALFGHCAPLDIVLIFIIALTFILDAVDGIVARKRNETSEAGALLDIIADRIVENTFWIYFTAIGLTPLWMPITIMTRGFLTDSLRRYIPPGAERWAPGLTGSRTSRGFYGGSKMVTFICLASTRIFGDFPVLEEVGLRLAIFTVGFCLIRGLPILVDTYKTARKRETDAKRFRPVPQSTQGIARRETPKKTVRRDS